MIGVLDWGRRVGKDTVCLTLSGEAALRRPRSRIPYGAATQDAVKELLLPTAQWLFADGPSDVRPTWKKSEHAFEFPNQSRIVIAGLDMHPDHLRGPHMDFGVISEAAFVSNLAYVVEHVFGYMMLGRDDAFLILNSSAPLSSAHAFDSKFVPQAKATRTYSFRTIEDSPRYTPQQLDALAELVGGRDSVSWLRESMGVRITDPTRSLVPEFHAVKHDIVIRGDVERPKHFDRYVAMDPGFTDLCAVLYAHVDFNEQTLDVTHELALSQANTKAVADALKSMEAIAWTKPLARTERLLRISDTDKRLIADLQSDHGVLFSPTRKHDRDTAMANLRTAVQQKKIRIHERCVTLLAHLEHGIWNRARTDFDRSDEAGLSHFDAVAALMYLWRNVDMKRNPYPALDPSITHDEHFIRPGAQLTKEERALKQIFPARFARRR